MNTAAQTVIHRFGLEPHPEGGWFREIFRSPHAVQCRGQERSALTVIHFLLIKGVWSAWHRIAEDEVWFFSDGSAVEQLIATPDFNTITRRRIIDSTPVSVVPAGWWQASYTDGDWALVQCAVAPGFEYAGFELARDTAYSAMVREDLAWLL